MRLTRRRALGYAAAGGASLAAPASALVDAARADQATDALLAELSGLLTLELTAVESYDLFVASGVATQRTRPTLKRCRDHDVAHAHRLRLAIQRLGGVPAQAPNPGDVAGLRDATTEPAALDFAIALEEQTISSYRAIFRMISHRLLVRSLGSVMAANAQHLAVLRELAGSPPAPSAFENGSTP